MVSMSEKQRRLPSWLLGLILAVIVFVIALFVINALGYGDDPAFGQAGGGIRLPLQSIPSAGR